MRRKKMSVVIVRRGDGGEVGERGEVCGWGVSNKKKIQKSLESDFLESEFQETNMALVTTIVLMLLL